MEKILAEGLGAILRHGPEMVCGGLSFVMTVKRAHAMSSQYSKRSNSKTTDVLPTATDFASTNEECVDISGRCYVCTSTEESSRLRASMSLRVKVSVCTRATILKEAQSQG